MSEAWTLKRGQVWVLFDCDEEGWQSFVSDSEVPPIMQEAGQKVGPEGRSSTASSTPRTSPRAEGRLDPEAAARAVAVGVVCPEPRSSR